MRTTPELLDAGVIVCPACRGRLLEKEDRRLRCDDCGAAFPVARGVPVLLLERSGFSASEAAAGSAVYYQGKSVENLRKRKIRQALPGLASDVEHRAVDRLVQRSLDQGSAPLLGLVVGSGFHVDEYSSRFPGVDWLCSDVEATAGAGVVADVLDLPLADSSIDLVVAEHVLEHVVDPRRAAQELERVLRPGGIALVKIPFNHPWHGGWVDFFRVTPAGMLALFRRCEAIHIGQGAGPASTVAYAAQSIWVSLFRRRMTRIVASGVGRLAFGWLRKLDRFLLHREHALMSSCSIVFVGRRVEHERTAMELIEQGRALGNAPVRSPDTV